MAPTLAAGAPTLLLRLGAMRCRCRLALTLRKARSACARRCCGGGRRPRVLREAAAQAPRAAAAGRRGGRQLYRLPSSFPAAHLCISGGARGARGHILARERSGARGTGAGAGAGGVPAAAKLEALFLAAADSAAGVAALAHVRNATVLLQAPTPGQLAAGTPCAAVEARRRRLPLSAWTLKN